MAITRVTSYDGARLAVMQYGDADAEPLLLIAGQSLAGAAWAPVAVSYTRLDVYKRQVEYVVTGRRVPDGYVWRRLVGARARGEGSRRGR